MRGRGAEWAAVLTLLGGVASRTGNVLLVQGRPGSGRTLLLDEATGAASALGMAVVTGRADELGRLTPLGPLLSALPAIEAGNALCDGSGRLLWPDGRVRASLEDRLRSGPLLVVLDDLQWADPATLMVLRTLPARLADRPVAWLLACRGAPPRDAPGRLFDLLETDGAVRITLGPLDREAVAGVCADLLGAPPAPGLAALAAQAGGDPLLLSELLTGLREEGAVRVEGGLARPAGPPPASATPSGGTLAEPVPAGTAPVRSAITGTAPVDVPVETAPTGIALPRRLHVAVRRRLDELGGGTRHLLEAAAVLGRSFSPERVAGLFGETPGAVLPALEEALASGVLVTTPGGLAFGQEVLWRSVAEGMPEPVRRALRERAGHACRTRPARPPRDAGGIAPGPALLAWDEGLLSRGLELAREAVDRPGRGRHRWPRAVLASMLIDLWLLDEAEAVTEDAAAEAGSEAGSEPDPAAGIGVLRARLALAAGTFDRVVEHAGTALAAARGPDAPGLACSALSVLGVGALRAGDLPGAVGYMARRPARWSWGLPSYERLRAELAAGRIGEARTGPVDAMAALGGVYAALPRHPAALTCEPATAAWLVRVAVAAGEPDRADAVVEAAEGLAWRNPGLPGPSVAAGHARGLREGDPEALGRAVAGYADPWARGSAAEDLGVLLDAGGCHREPVVESLRTALACYGAVEATRDAARVRGRLRLLGERRRHWTRTDRPVSGWASLTGTERAVCALVAQGLTNRHAAEQMFISEHTVAFHLRQVFRKLGIRSRVELARLAVQENGRSLH
ncbi:AAA family ATPase [Streptosporangium sp. NPDC050855]|uniref:helix-turn-helix transcriptional regulator n=1 Tax=Streptosporangium sp. NPDC050855 TaxID=3366194 RepID=UPI0037AB3642